jgi:alpha-beta hydrolase superfamily lysophospholipase
MLTRFEGSFLAFDQIELFFQTWIDSAPRGTIVITHGLSEHSECYHALAKSLAAEGWQVFAWDLRGHGRSDGKRGLARNLSEFEQDLDIFVNKIVRTERKSTTGPLILFGHSMGGLITLRALVSGLHADALVLSSPALGLSVKVPAIKHKIAIYANKWAPTLTLYNEIKYTDLTRDGEMIKLYQKDNLRHDKISPGIFLSMLESFDLITGQAEKIKLPVLMQLAGEDRIVSSEASRAFFEKLPGKKNHLEIYPESYHETYNDLDRDRVISDLKKFINPYLGGTST